jgi:hypothetical protein
LNGDKSDEFVLLTVSSGLVYENHAGQWVLAADIYLRSAGWSKSKFAGAIIGELNKGNLSATTPKWNDLSIGGRAFRVVVRAPAADGIPRPSYIPPPQE